MAEDVAGGALWLPHPLFAPWRKLGLVICFIQAVSVFPPTRAGSGTPNPALQRPELEAELPPFNNVYVPRLLLSPATKSTPFGNVPLDRPANLVPPQVSQNPGHESRKASARRTAALGTAENDLGKDGEPSPNSKSLPNMAVGSSRRRLWGTAADPPRRDRPSAYTGGYYTHTPNYEDTRDSPFATPGGPASRDTFWAKRENFIFAFITLLATAIISETLHQVRVRREVRRRRRKYIRSSESSSSLSSSSSSSVRSSRWETRRRDYDRRGGPRRKRRRYSEDYSRGRNRDRYSDEEDSDDRPRRSGWGRAGKSEWGRRTQSTPYNKDSSKKDGDREPDASREDSEKDTKRYQATEATEPLLPRAPRGKPATQHGQAVSGATKANQKGGSTTSETPAPADVPQPTGTVAKNKDQVPEGVRVTESGEASEQAPELSDETEPALVAVPAGASATKRR
ncbi:hypothetical protein CSUI_005310 [Cystoisospora suis]|uniref:Transmembrane protein n=1 Tax=Cystoisospora suis TaxID=483139 RepID=A0A2C6K6Z8_9APIC|nr:hypothetical protein CSUI_005310 [Cystoisospora suis]